MSFRNFILTQVALRAIFIGNYAIIYETAVSINDEGAITFRITYENGKTVDSSPIYFSRGTKVIVTILGNEVKLRYDFE